MSKKLLKTAMSYILLTLTSCQAKVENQSVRHFFSTNDWESFNAETLKRRNLDHFIEDNVDFFHRQSFFDYMKTEGLNWEYEDFFLIEIESRNGEIFGTKKIFLLKYEDAFTYVPFELHRKWEKSTDVKEDIQKYKYEDLKDSSYIDDNGNYIFITKIK